MVISGRTGEDDVFKALELGAVDFIAKPTPRAAPELINIERELIRKVHSIRELRIEKVRERLSAIPRIAHRGDEEPVSAPKLVAIGSSTGGPAALTNLGIVFNLTLTSGETATINGNFAVITVPEPATLGMISAVGGGILFIRRRFLI